MELISLLCTAIRFLIFSWNEDGPWNRLPRPINLPSFATSYHDWRFRIVCTIVVVIMLLLLKETNWLLLEFFCCTLEFNCLIVKLLFSPYPICHLCAFSVPFVFHLNKEFGSFEKYLYAFILVLHSYGKIFRLHCQNVP